MAPHIVKCPQCGTELDLSAFSTGQVVACPCGAQLTVPQAPLQPAQPLQPPPPPQPAPYPSAPHTGPYPPPPNVPPMPPPSVYSQEALAAGKEANDALIFAIISIFCLHFILGPIAIVKANRAKKFFAANPHVPGSGKATAAFVLGIITTILGVLVILWYLIVLLATMST